MYPELDTLKEEKHFTGSAGDLDYEISQQEEERRPREAKKRRRNST